MRSIYALIRSHTIFNFLDVGKRKPRAKVEILKLNPSGTTRTVMSNSIPSHRVGLFGGGMNSLNPFKIGILYLYV